MKNKHTGSSFDSFLEKEKIKDYVDRMCVQSNSTTDCQKEITELIKTKYPYLHLATLELWDVNGKQGHRTILKYKEWVKKTEKLISDDKEKC